MAKPMRIDDRQFFAGSGSPKFPVGNKVKEYHSSNGAGEESDYEDTSEEVMQQQQLAAAKVKSHPMKPNHRN